MNAVKFRFCELEEERLYSSACTSVTGARAMPIFMTLFSVRAMRRALRDREKERYFSFPLPRETEDFCLVSNVSK